MRTKSLPRLIVILLFFCFFFSSCSLFFDENTKGLVIKNGFLDLSSWVPEKEKLWQLAGEWKFKWMEDNPEFSEVGYDDSCWDTIQVGKVWNSKTGTPFGYGWLRLKVKVKSGNNLALYLTRASTAYTMYANGKKIMSNGVAGNESGDSIAQNRPLVSIIPDSDTGTIVLAWKISNFHYTEGGPDYSPSLGTLTSCESFLRAWTSRYAFEIGLICTLGIYHLFLWFLRRKEKADFFLFFICLIYNANFLADSLVFEMLFPNIRLFEPALKVTFITDVILPVTFVFYYAELFSIKLPSLFYKSILTISGLWSIFTIFAPARIFGYGYPAVLLFDFGCIFFIIITLVRAALVRKTEAYILLSVMCFGFIAFVIDYVIPLFGIVTTSDTLMSIFTYLFLLAHSAITSMRFMKAYCKAEYLSENLGKEVQLQTNRLEEQQQLLLSEQESRFHEKLVHTDKLAALGTLVASVAHEINNPNQAILLNSQTSAKSWKEIMKKLDNHTAETGDFPIGRSTYGGLKNEMTGSFDLIAGCSERIKKIIADLKGFARINTQEEWIKVDINEIIVKILAIMRAQLMQYTENLRLCLLDGLPEISGQYHRIEQVLVNLVQNACQALDDKGKAVYISTAYIENKRQVQVTVKDEGIGMSEEQLEKIAQPFFTTKERGIGIGLFVVARIVKEHGGTIEFLSRRGDGTTVVVTLPV